MAQIEIAAMNPDEIIKAAPELLKHGAELVGALKLTEIAKAMLGPATGEFAERVKDEIRLYRFGRQLELLKKAEKMVEDAGFTPKAVPIKLLFPLLEGASLEENEDLHTMWASLLANAASPTAAVGVRPHYISLLRQMAPDEAALLNWICCASSGASIDDEIAVDDSLLICAYVLLGLGPEHRSDDPSLVEDAEAFLAGTLPYNERLHSFVESFSSRYDSYTRSKLLLDSYRPCRDVLLSTELIRIKFGNVFLLTSLGKAFASACQPPKPKP